MADALAELASLDTDTLSLGRRTPRTPGQRAEALAGIAACNREWFGAGPFTTGDDMIRAGWSAYKRAGYELRHVELASATLVHRERAVAVRS
jgi:hypothetical protein